MVKPDTQPICFSGSGELRDTEGAGPDMGGIPLESISHVKLN